MDTSSSNEKIYPASEISNSNTTILWIMPSIFPSLFSPILIQKSELEKLIEFVVISEFNPDLVLNDEETTFNQISWLISLFAASAVFGC